MLIAAALVALPALTLLALLFSRFDWPHRVVPFGIFFCCLGLAGAGLEQLENFWGPITKVLPFGLPWLKAHFHVDNLASLFLLIVNLPAAAVAWFSSSYLAHLPEKRRVTPFLPLFIFAMNMVVIADDAFIFLLSWEFMSLTSWAMVLYQHQDPENRKAALVYLIMALFGTLCLLLSFGLMAGGEGDYTFATMRSAEMSAFSGFLVVLLAILGAGSKAGVAPLHAWLPLAHPAAPSPVSALMSGVMTKVALYGLIRILFDLHGKVAWQWGAALMVLGGVTAVLGVLYAVLQDDLKRLLAYSTVENVGIVLIGLGLSLAFKADERFSLATLALIASLYHVINHSVFKTLLFLGSGSVQASTGMRSLAGLGGLLKRMPWTGGTFLVGAAAISALPPLNGFVSEWMILQALFKGPDSPHWAMKFGVPVVGVLLALSVALAATCFVRAFGVAFLGRPRSSQAAQAVEVSGGMLLPMVVLAGLCVVLGVIPVTVTNALAVVVQPLTGTQLAVSGSLGWPWLAPVSDLRGSYSGTVLVLLGVLLFLLGIALARLIGVRGKRVAEAWDCGHREDIPQAQYSAASFAQPLRRVFGTAFFQVEETVTMPPPGSLLPARHRLTLVDPIWSGIYQRIAALVSAIADRVNPLQHLTIRRYLLLMFVTLIVFLLVVAVRQQL